MFGYSHLYKYSFSVSEQSRYLLEAMFETDEVTGFGNKLVNPPYLQRGVATAPVAENVRYMFFV